MNELELELSIKGELSIGEILRAGHVKRWQIVRTCRQQTLSEHMYNVAMISIEICDKLFIDNIDPIIRTECIEWSLHHDLPEVVTGDIVSPIKEVMRSEIDVLEASISEKYVRLKNSICTLTAIIVKFADLIDAVAFLEIEGLGAHSKFVQSKIEQKIEQKIIEAMDSYPRTNWHIISEILNCTQMYTAPKS